MSTQPLSVLAPHYICRICRKPLPSLGPPIIGEKPLHRMVRVAQLMAGHLGEEHQREMMTIGIAGQQVRGWMITEQFEHNDGDLEKASNDARLQFRQNTKRVRISDEMIESQIVRVIDPFLKTDTPSDGPLRASIVSLLKTMRDSLDEVPAA